MRTPTYYVIHLPTMIYAQRNNRVWSTKDYFEAQKLATEEGSEWGVTARRPPR